MTYNVFGGMLNLAQALFNPADATATPYLCFSKTQNALSFWYQLTQFVSRYTGLGRYYQPRSYYIMTVVHSNLYCYYGTDVGALTLLVG